MRIINLLPKTKQQELGYERVFHSVVRLAEIVGSTLIIVIAAQLFVQFYLVHARDQRESTIEQLKAITNKQENAKLKQQITGLNGQIADLNKLAAASPTWSQVLLALSADIPPEVKLTQLAGALDKKQVRIQGYSPTREQVIALYNNIKNDSKHFSSINYPLENVSRPADVLFHFEIEVTPETMNIKPPGK